MDERTQTQTNIHTISSSIKSKSERFRSKAEKLSKSKFSGPGRTLSNNKSENSLLNILKHVFSRVYLNIYDGGDFTQPSELTLKAALMEFFLPTTKRKLHRKIQNINGKIDWWSHWLGAGSSELSVPKAAFIIFLDMVLFFPRLALNVVKVFTEVLPDVIAQLFFLAYNEAHNRYNYLQNEKAKIAASSPAYSDYSALANAHIVAMGLAAFGAAIFKFIYFVGCSITSPIATSIRAKNFNYKHDILPEQLSKVLSDSSFFSSHLITPMICFGCYFAIALLLANLIPGLGFVLTTLAVTTLLGMVAAYLVIDHVLSCFNRNPNGDSLIDYSIGEDDLRNEIRYTDRDISYERASTCDATEIHQEVEVEIRQTLKYKYDFFQRREDHSARPTSEEIALLYENKGHT